MNIKPLLLAIIVFALAACHRPSDEEIQSVNVPEVQVAGQENSYAVESFTGGIRLNFQMSGITHIELESVDGYAIAGTANMTTIDGHAVVAEVTDKQSIITFRAPSDGTLNPRQDYYIVTFPCDIYGGYRLSIYKDGLVAHYFGVHQVIEAGQYIAPLDLDESELEFVDPSVPLVEE